MKPAVLEREDKMWTKNVDSLVNTFKALDRDILRLDQQCGSTSEDKTVERLRAKIYELQDEKGKIQERLCKFGIPIW